MKAFKNRLEEMAEATVNTLDYSDSKVEYPDISMVQKWPKEIILPLYDLYKNRISHFSFKESSERI